MEKAHSRRDRMTDYHTFANTRDDEYQRCRLFMPARLVHSPMSNERDFDKVDNNTLVSCRMLRKPLVDYKVVATRDVATTSLNRSIDRHRLLNSRFLPI